MTPLYAGVGGVVRELTEMYTGIGGVVKPMTEMWAGVGGVNRQIFKKTIAIGNTIQLNENNVAVDYLVVHLGLPSSIYDNSCDGVWLLRKDIIEKRVYESSNSNALETSEIQNWLNSPSGMLGKYDADTQAAIKTVKIPYRSGGGPDGTDQTGGNGLSCKVFLLSGYEVGWTTSDNQNFPIDGSVLSYFQGISGSNSKRIAYLNGNATRWWLRSPYVNLQNYVWNIYINGTNSSDSSVNSYGVRPALILPFNFFPKEDNK